MLCDFTEKNTTGKGNLYLTENWLFKVETKCGVRQITEIICVTLYANGFLDSNFNEAVIDKIYHIFTKLSQISHIHKNRYFFFKV